MTATGARKIEWIFFAGFWSVCAVVVWYGSWSCLQCWSDHRKGIRPV